MYTNCPFLMPRDMLSLDPVFKLQNGQLHDEPIGASHRVHQTALPCMQLLVQGDSYRQLIATAQAQHITTPHLMTLLGFLSAIGALRIKRQKADRIKAVVIRCSHLLLGVRYPQSTWRRAISFRTLCVAILRTTWPVGVGATLSSSLLVVANFCTVLQAATLGTYMLLLFAGSLLVHELAHYHILSRHTQVVVLQRGLRLGLVHRELPRWLELRSAIMGPLMGGGCGVMMAVVFAVCNANELCIASLLVATFHTGSLLPWYADGASIWKGTSLHA